LKGSVCFDAEDAAKLEKKMRNEEFTLEKFLEQMQQVKTKLAPWNPSRYASRRWVT
jgi:signal recognition particle subunit SRP54